MEKHVQSAEALAVPGGLHMVARLPDRADEAAAVLACRTVGLSVSPLRAYYGGQPTMKGLVMGFAATPVAMAADCAKRLEIALQSAQRKSNTSME